MADKWPLANGNWSSAANWNGGTKPVAGDDVYADGKTIAIDEDVTVGSIRNTQRSGGTVGGGFTAGGGRIITANVNGFMAGSGSTLLVTSGTTSTTLNGNIVGSSLASVYVVQHTGTGPLIINGNITGGTVTGSYGLALSSSGTVTITGNVEAGASTNSFAVHKTTGDVTTLNIIGNVSSGNFTGTGNHGVYGNVSNLTLNITGNIYAIRSSPAISLGGGGHTINIVGNVFGSTTDAINTISTPSLTTTTITGNLTANNGTCLSLQNTHYVTVNGNLFGGTGGSQAAIAFNNPLGTLTINGNITGGGTSSSYGLWAQNATSFVINGNVTGGTGGVGIAYTASASLTVNGSAIGGTGANGISSAGAGAVFVNRCVGNDFGSGSTGIGATVGLSHTTQNIARCKYFECGSRGMWPVFGPVLVDLQTDTTIQTRTNPSQTLFTFTNPANTSGLLPLVTDVRSGVNYNVGNLTGTCAVPAPINVTSGVLVGNTVGTAILTEQTIRSAMGLSTANLDTKFNNLSTQIGTLLSNSPTEAF